MKKEKKTITYVSMIICFILIFIYCLSPFAVGLNHAGNNTEFEKAVGLNGANDGFFYKGYTITDDSVKVNGSMYTIIRPLIVALGSFSTYFDIRILSFIYALILIISVYYLNKYVCFNNKTLDIIYAALVIFIVFDLSYLLYLNTLYAEGMFYALFVLEISLYIKLINSEAPKIPTTIIFGLIAVLLCGLKANLLMLIIPFILMLFYLFYKRKDILYRIICVLMTILVIVYPVLNYKDYQNENLDKFHSMFYGILYENNDVNSTLREFDIDTKYNSLAGKNHFDKLQFDISSKEFENEVLNKISYSKIFNYYVKNPSKYAEQYKYVGWNAFETYPKYVGNFSAQSNKTAYDIAGGFNIYNFIKSKIFPKTLWFVYLIPLLLVAIMVVYRKYFNKGYIVLSVALAMINIILFNAPMITSGLVDLSRTMAIYNISFDAILLMVISCMIYISHKRKQEFKEQYGLTQ